VENELSTIINSDLICRLARAKVDLEDAINALPKDIRPSIYTRITFTRQDGKPIYKINLTLSNEIEI